LKKDAVDGRQSTL